MHARIRNECSNLNSDLHQLFILINPLCNCNLEYENAEHYFFRCPNNLNERTRLFNETQTFHPLNPMSYLVFFSPFSIAITSLGEDRANFSAFRTFVRFALVRFCLFPLPLPLSVWERLRFVIVTLPGPFLLPFFLDILLYF